MKVIFQKTIISPTYLNDFIELFGGLWVDLGLIWDRFWHMEVYLGPLWGHFGVTLGPLWAYRRRMACMMHTISLCVGAWWDQKAEMLKKYLFLKHF